jgi:hypothetical protein
MRFEISLIVEEMIHAAQSALKGAQSKPKIANLTFVDIFPAPIFESDYGPIEKYGKISYYNCLKWMTINNETTNTVWSMAKEMETAFTKDNIYVQVLWLASSMAGEGMM